MNERRGELFLFGYTVTFSFFPIIANYAAKIMPPIFFIGVSTLLTGIIFLIFHLIFPKNLRTLTPRVFLYILGNAVFNVILAFTFIYIGTSKTSGINTSLLINAELFFSFLICGIFFHEKITQSKVIGGLFILIGATTILYNGSFHLNIGDLLIITATLFYPFGNQFSKQALKYTTPSVIVFVRSVIGGMALLTMSLLFENFSVPITSLWREHFLLFLVNGIFLLGVAKLLWFEGLKGIDISKAVPLAMAGPAFSIVYAMIFLREIPTPYQILGFFVILMGLFVLTRQKREEIELV